MGKGVSQADIWRKSIPGTRKSWSKYLKVGVCLVCFWNSKEPMWLERSQSEEVGLLKSLHPLSFTTLCLLSFKSFRAERVITEKIIQKRY